MAGEPDPHLDDTSDDGIRRKAVIRRLYQASTLCTLFIVVEVIGGLLAHSLAILSDAAHLLSDLTSFAVAIGASHLASLPATRQHTYGLKRTESIAALFSMISLACVCVGLGFEAIHRLVEPPAEKVDGKLMSGIATIGVLVNVALALVLGEDHVHMPGAHSHDHGDHDSHDDHDDHHGHDHSHGHGHHDAPAGYKKVPSYQNGDHSHDHDHMEEGHAHSHTDHSPSHDHKEHSHDSHHDHESKHYDTFHDESHEEKHEEVAVDKRNINLRAAYLHVLADLAQSVAVLIAGAVIWVKPEWHAIDPILTLLFALLVLYSTFGVVRSSIAVLMEETPPNISWQKVYDGIASVPNVTKVHDLHIWSISHGNPTLSVHCHSDDPKALENIRNKCCEFGITHSTIQIQSTGSSCITCGDEGCCTAHLM